MYSEKCKLCFSQWHKKMFWLCCSKNGETKYKQNTYLWNCYWYVENYIDGHVEYWSRSQERQQRAKEQL